MNFRNQNGQGKHNTVKEESHHVGYDFPNKEETVDDIEFLPQCNFLQYIKVHKNNIRKCLGLVKCVNIVIKLNSPYSLLFPSPFS